MTPTSLGLDTPDKRDPLVADIERRREEAGWSMNELSRRSGVSLRSVWAALRGERGVHLHTLRLLAAAFDLEPALVPKEVAGG